MTEGLYSKCSSYMFPHDMERAGMEIRSNIYLCTAIIHDIDVDLEMLYNCTLQNIMDITVQGGIV